MSKTSKSSPVGFAFFDLDHTLLPYDTQLLFCNYIVKRQPYRALFLLLFVPIFPLALFKLIRAKGLKKLFLSFLWGMKASELERLAEDFVRSDVIPAIYPELRNEIERHKKEKRITVLNSASPLIYVKFIARELGFDHYYGTKVEYGERFPFLPHFPTENNKGLVKLTAMREILPPDIKEQLPTDPTQAYQRRTEFHVLKSIPNSYSYSDSPADLPLLVLSEKGYLVHPISTRLIGIGKREGWTTLKPNRPHESKTAILWALALQALGLYRVQMPSTEARGV